MATATHTVTAASLAFAFAATAATPAEYCVSCDGPQAHYTCAIEGAGAAPEDTRLKLYCMTELAKSGGHASCAIDRTQPKPCGGISKVLAAPAGLDLAQPASTAPPQTSAPTQSPGPANGAAAKSGTPAASGNETAIEKTPAPPKTVQEMVEKGAASAGESLGKSGETASEAANSAGGALQKAGKAVSDAAKKTWTCVTSLFGNC